MRTAVISSDNQTLLKIGFTAEELQKIMSGEPKEFQFDKFGHQTYKVLIKKISPKADSAKVEVKRKA
jgi:hypothetical protein